MNYKKHILLFLLLIFCFTDCKKYPEGPLISFRLRSERLSGVWEPENYFINGIDSIDALKLTPSYAPYTFAVDKGGSSNEEVHGVGVSTYPYPVAPIGVDTCDRHGYWDFIDNREKLYVKLRSSKCQNISTMGPYGMIGEVEWDIIKLKYKELWLEVVYNNKTYHVRFKKIKELKNS